MCVISINIPEEVVLCLGETRTEPVSQVKEMVAVEFYKNRKVSLGYCAEIAEMSKERRVF